MLLTKDLIYGLFHPAWTDEEQAAGREATVVLFSDSLQAVCQVVAAAFVARIDDLKSDSTCVDDPDQLVGVHVVLPRALAGSQW